MAIENRLYDKYKSEIIDNLKNTLGLKTVMNVPKLEKIVINMGLGEATGDKKILTDAIDEVTLITGQKAVATVAKKSNASFKIREDYPIGLKVTLRGQKMYDFLDKLITIALPRIRDFRGVNHKSFDGRGNYTMGIKEFLIFPEIDYDQVKHMKGMDITFVTTGNDKEAYELLKEFGMPFKNLAKENN